MDSNFIFNFLNQLIVLFIVHIEAMIYTYTASFLFFSILSLSFFNKYE